MKGRKKCQTGTTKYNVMEMCHNKHCIVNMHIG